MRAYELLEYKTDITQQKYDAVLKQISPDDSILQKIEQADPTKNKQYVLWIIKQLQSKLIRIEDLNRVLQALTNFDQLKPRLLANQRDLGRMTIHQLEAVVDTAMGTETTDEFKLDIPNAKVLYNGPLGTLVVPKTEEAACDLGKGTKWCTSADKDNQFDEYNEQGPIYIWKDKTGKYQFHFDTYQLMDSHDVPLEQDKINEFLRNPVLKKLFDDNNYDEVAWYVMEKDQFRDRVAAAEGFIAQFSRKLGASNSKGPLMPEEIKKLTSMNVLLLELYPEWLESELAEIVDNDEWEDADKWGRVERLTYCFLILRRFVNAGIYPKSIINVSIPTVEDHTYCPPELKNMILQWLKSFKPTPNSITL